MVLYVRNVSPSFLGTGLFLFFGICCLSALKLAGASLGLWEICIIWGLGISLAVYLTAGISGASEPRRHRRPVAVCLLPGQKSVALYRGPGRRRVWRRRVGLDTLQHPVYAI
ncbi:aquaporin [Klebsiella variicola subsp. variicola]|nr:aquaporin [Klebsiella variicola subsp. variicola]